MERYVYYWAVDVPEPPWTGPCQSHRAAVTQARRHERGEGAGSKAVVFIKPMMQVGPNSYMSVGMIERVEPEG